MIQQENERRMEQRGEGRNLRKRDNSNDAYGSKKISTGPFLFSIFGEKEKEGEIRLMEVEDGVKLC